jgi:hypothetical protein
MWDVTGWSKVVFSDECAFNVGGRYGKPYVTGRAYVQSLNRNFKRIGTIMVFGREITSQNYVNFVLRPRSTPYYEHRGKITKCIMSTETAGSDGD